MAFVKQTRPNFITESIKRNGEYFYDIVNPEDLKRGMPKLSRDIVNCNIELNKHGHYILEDKIYSQLINYLDNKITKHSLISMWGQSFYDRYLPQGNLELAVLEDEKRTVEAYVTLKSKIVIAKTSNDPLFLGNLRSEMRNYRGNI